MKDKKIGKLFKLKREGDRVILPEYVYPIKSDTHQYEVLIVVDSDRDFAEAHDRLMVERPAMNKYYELVEDA